MNRHDLLDWLRDAIMNVPLTAEHVERVLDLARQEYGGDTVYIRSRPAVTIDPVTRLRVQRVTRRTLQRRQSRE
ncbi:MAG: hypothetical protein NHG36_20015 [Chromatiaceae bacterium]|nr:hypothetical protein [Candidatus Thioaporhodococcus sediminis]